MLVPKQSNQNSRENDTNIILKTICVGGNYESYFSGINEQIQS